MSGHFDESLDRYRVQPLAEERVSVRTRIIRALHEGKGKRCLQAHDGKYQAELKCGPSNLPSLLLVKRSAKLSKLLGLTAITVTSDTLESEE